MPSGLCDRVRREIEICESSFYLEKSLARIAYSRIGRVSIMYS